MRKRKNYLLDFLTPENVKYISNVEQARHGYKNGIYKAQALATESENSPIKYVKTLPSQEKRVQ